MNRREFLIGAATLPITLRLAPEALAGGTAVALVTADTQSRVAVVELDGGRILRSIPTLPGPRSIESNGGLTAIICHTAHGAVSLVDGASLRVRRVLRGFAEPRYTALTQHSRYAFITDSGRGEVVSVDLWRGRVVGRVAVGGPARHISIDPNGRILWVSLGSKADVVAIVDASHPAAPQLLHRIRPPFLAHDVGLAPGGRHVWISSGDRGSLAVYHRRTGEVLRRLSADAPPQHVTFYGGNAYVTSGDDGTMRIHSLRDGRVLRTTAIPVGSYNVQRGWRWVLTPSLQRGTLCIFDPRGRLLRRVHVSPSSHDACFVLTA